MEGVWVLVIVGRTPEQIIILIPVKNRKSETLTEFIRKFVHKDSIIYTDCWKGYTDLKHHFFKHCTVNHSVSFKDPITSVHTNPIEVNWCAVKKSVLIRCRTVDLVLPYLIRFMILRNFKKDAFSEFIKLLF